MASSECRYARGMGSMMDWETPEGMAVVRLKSAYVRRWGRLDGRGERMILAALERLKRDETTIEMELRRIGGGFRLY